MQNLSENLTPLAIKFSPNASKLWREFYLSIEKELGLYGKYSEMKDFASKSPTHCARLAANFAYCEDITVKEISEDIMRNAIIVTSYYLDEQLELRKFNNIGNNLSTSQEIKDAFKLHDKIQAKMSRLNKDSITFLFIFSLYVK